MEKNTFISKNKSLLYLILFSFIIRILIFIRFEPWNQDVINKIILIFDSLGYHKLALCIVNNHSFCGEAFRTPGYPFFVSIIYAIFGSQPEYVMLVQIFLNLLSILLMYKTGTELFSNKVGFIAALLFSLDIHHTIFIYYILTETIYTTVFLLALLYYIKGIKNNRLSFLIFSGLLYGISTLIRPISQYYILGLIAFTVLWYIKDWKTAVKYSFIIGITYFISIAPWCYRNYSEFGYFQLSNIKGYSFLFWDASYYEAKRQHKTIDEVNANFYVELRKMGWTPEGNPFEKEKYLLDLAQKTLSPHFADYLKMHLLGAVKIHLSLGTQSLTDVLHIPAKKFSEEEKYTNGVCVLIKKFFTEKTTLEIILGLYVALFLVVIYTFSIVGIYKMYKDKSILLILFLLGSAGYFTLISGIVSYARYRLPSMPFYILLASAGIIYLLERRSKPSELNK